MANQQKVLHSMILQSPDHPEDPSNSPSNKDERSPPPTLRSRRLGRELASF